MPQKVLLIKLLLVHYATLSLTEIHANCNQNVSLKCPGATENMDFLSLTWYKLHSQKKHGIIRRMKTAHDTQNYNFARPATFGENHSLLLHQVTPEDSGSYECAVSANIGGKNLYLKVDLIVNACVTEANPTTRADVLKTTHSEVPCQKQEMDLPIMWCIIGLVLMGIGKIILSFICIRAIRALHTRSQRRRQMKW